MKIIMEEDAREYLNKNGITRVLIDMIPGMTNSGCGCGKTKKFYTPDIRPARENEHFGKEYLDFSVNDIQIYVSPKAMQAAAETIKIKIEKSLFMKKLDLEGFEFIVE